MNTHVAPTSDVQLWEVVRDPRAWPRKEIDPERVALFMAFYADGGIASLPPIEVVEAEAGVRILSDGWTRFEAATRLGLTELPAQIVAAPPDSEPHEYAFHRALEHSTSSAKPLSLAERRAAAKRLLEASGGMSLREIGRLTGLSHQTVSRLREAMTGPIDQTNEPPDEAYLAQGSAAELSDRLVRGMVKVWEARGLTDLVSRRMPGTLANALSRRFGEAEAIQWAHRLERWAASAAACLEGR